MMRVLVRALLFALALALAGGLQAQTRDPDTHFFHPFLGDLRDELAQVRASNRKALLVMYHFDDCPACKRMRREVLNQSDVQDWFRREFVVIPLDILGAQPITDFSGKTLDERAYGLRPRRQAPLSPRRWPVHAGRVPAARPVHRFRRLPRAHVQGLPAKHRERKLK